MNFAGGRNRGRALVTIDITALIDVVFLLLIFLLVTTTFRKDDHAFLIEMPTSSAKEVSVTIDKTTVYVDKTGGLHLLLMPANGAPTAPSKATKVSPEALTQKLTALYAKDPEQEIAIRGERKAQFQRMVDVIAIIKDVGFRKVWFPYEHDTPKK